MSVSVNISKNDMIVEDSKMTRQWPEVVLQHKPLYAKYCKAAHSTGMLIMDMLADKLGIDREEIRQRHRIEEMAGDRKFNASQVQHTALSNRLSRHPHDERSTQEDSRNARDPNPKPH